ncbi:putative ABC transporter ATP-binding protein [Flavihumibacter petaseus NBRC 106054]|uniref:Putative ABC transporter ATP-binding protein n=1 Tax=Flavihumibacter petaseus NBRC 106054 TaxID=1220578 RepID=A0A0E9MUW6_9BACT|nr:putative ABC transporter ATP-binding protein [Flavihumibacter petaseus NBRC 106054]
MALVGESGSGKSITAMSVLQLLPAENTRYPSGKILFSPHGETAEDLLLLPEKRLRHIRGGEVGMIFQEPMTSLNPVFTCGEQVAETIRLHEKVTQKEARRQTITLFEKVRLPDPEGVYDRYPHQLSGGQKQRVMIAMAVSCRPALLIADEPTTALDVTVQQHILELLDEFRRTDNLGILFITHDLGVVQDVADKVAVLYKGNLVEQGPVRNVFGNPQHPYTRALLACRPILHARGKPLPVVADFLQDDGKTAVPVPAPASAPESAGTGKKLLSVESLSVSFGGQKPLLGKRRPLIRAVNNVSFDVYEGETLGIVGESGCGKTTLGRAILRLVKPASGKIIYGGSDLLQLDEKEWRPLRQEFQLVFQDPYGSLNPKQPVGQAITEPLQVHFPEMSRGQKQERLQQLLEAVNLLPEHALRYPFAFSGGQRQRIGIARALVLEPGLIVFDESVSALDVSVQAQVLNLINRLKAELGFTAVFISHDLGVVRYISDRILVMEKGSIVEMGTPEKIFRDPESPYTQRLLAAIPGLPGKSGNPN